MQKATKWTIVFILFFTMIFITPIAEAETQSVIVNPKLINIRSGPGLTYAVIGSLKKGDRVNILATSDDWLQINVGNEKGWIASWLVSPSDKSATTSSTIVSRVDGLNIRSGPSVGSAILGRLNAGDEAIMTEP